MSLAAKWTSRFLEMAALVASWSKDPATQVGAVAINADRRVLETGFNGLPQGVTDTPERMLRPAKYLWTTHAEANLVAAAARSRLQGSTVFVTHAPCAQCAALLVNAGVAKVVYASGTTSMDPEQFRVAMQMFEEAGVEVQLAADGRSPADLPDTLCTADPPTTEVSQSHGKH